MWRAFFFATGIMLIILGIECIIVGKFRFANDSGLSKVAKKFWGTGGAEATPEVNPPSGLASGFPRNHSQFGASRFNNDAFFNVSNDARARGNSPFSLPSQGGVPTPSKATKRPKTLESEDWMPWSLIAAGTIIVLYTRSVQRNPGDH